MRTIKPSDYESFTIVGNGWRTTMYDFNKALHQWNSMNYGTFIGNKRNGETAILDSK
jgi:hypothetical protein